MPHSAAVATPDARKLDWRSSFASTYAHSSGSSSTSSSSSSDDDALDLEALALSAGSEYEDTFRSSRWRQSSNAYEGGYYGGASMKSAIGGGSGLPLVCSNCGVSFFSLQITDDELECYCSGECKWSVVMYREMDRRMHALRRRLRAATAVTAKRPAPAARDSVVTPARSSGARPVDASKSYAARMMDDVIPCR